MKSLRTRLLLQLAVLLTVVFALATAAVSVFVRQSLQRDVRVEEAYLDLVIRERALLLARQVRAAWLPEQLAGEAAEPEFSAWLTRVAAGLNPDVFMQVFDGEGRLAGTTLNLHEPLPLPLPLRLDLLRQNQVAVTVLRDSLGRPVRVATFPLRKDEAPDETVFGFAQAGLPLTDTAQRLRALTLWLIAGSALALAAALLLVRWLVHQWTRSASAITAAATRLDLKALPHDRLPAPLEDDELAALTRSLNALIDRLGTAHDAQRRFVADAAHELGTPLTVLRGEIALALRRQRPGEEYRSVLETCREEIERLSRVTENLLALAAADAGRPLIAREPADASTVATDVVRRLQKFAEAKHVDLTLEAPPQAPLLADATALDQILTNLAENALRHTPAGESVAVRVRFADDCVTLSVIDTGEGIPADQVPHLFERFHRVDQARTRARGGAGLGLAIVKTLAEAHGGEVRASSQLGSGSTFTVSLPREWDS